MLHNPQLSIVVVGLVLALILALAILLRRRRDKALPAEPTPVLPEARLEEGERRASMIAEAIEERVRAILAAQGEAELVGVDFGTASDGSLEIWLNGVRYSSVDDLPDKRLRDAIRRAVEEFNRPAEGEGPGQ
jgi:hypothetical protein